MLPRNWGIPPGQFSTMAEQIIESVQVLGKLPERLEGLFESLDDKVSRHIVELTDAVRTGIEHFQKAVEKDQHALFAGMQKRFEAHDSMIKKSLSVQDEQQRQTLVQLERLTTALQDLPENTRKAHDGLSERFGKEAANHVHELKNAVDDGIEKLMAAVEELNEKTERSFVSNCREIVKEIFDSLQHQIDGKLVGPLSTMAKHLEEATTEMPEAASRFATSLELSAATLGTLPQELDSTTKKVNQLADEFQSIVASSTLQAWRPVSENMNEFVSFARRAHEEHSNIINSLVSFIKELIDRIEVKH